MAFPDLGPLQIIAQYTQDGFSQGSFLFQLFAGEIAGSQALHYLGLMFALIGAVAITFLKQFHNIKTIGSWTFLVIIMLIGPSGGHFFYPIKANLEQNIHYDLEAFGPQAVVIDLMSKIHRAIYLGFFDISSPGNPRMRNPIEDLTKAQTSAGNKDMHLQERPDIQQEILAYETLGCGTRDDLGYVLYNDTLNSAFTDYSSNTSRPFNAPMFDIERTHELQQKTFTYTDLSYLLSSYDISFKRKLTYAPFGVIFEDIDHLRDSLIASGVDGKNVDRAMSVYDDTDGENLKKHVTLLAYALTTRDKVTDHINGDMSFFNPNADGILEMVTSGGGDNVNLQNAGTNANHEDPVLSAYVPVETALDDHIDSSFVSFLKFTNPTVEFVTTGHISPKHKADPIEQRLDNLRTAPWAGPGYESIALGETLGKWSDLTISLAFLTAAPRDIYAKRARQVIGGKTGRDLSRLQEHPTYNVINTCAQLHQMVRNHIKDALIYQNAWPGYSGNSSIAVGTSSAYTGIIGLDTSASLSEMSGFTPGVLNETVTVLGGDTIPAYSVYPYDIDGITSEAAAQYMPQANEKMVNLYDRVQNIASRMGYTDMSGATPVYRNPLSSPDDDTRGTAMEILRLTLVKSMIDKAIDVTRLPYMRKVFLPSQNKAPQTALDVAMNASTSSESIKKNIPNLSSGWLQDVTTWVSNIAVLVGAQFAGIGAVAFIHFLKIFIAIGLFFMLMCTPILYMMGLLVPAHSPGVIVVSLISVLALKAIPIGFTLVDAVMANAMRSYQILNFDKVDQAMMIYVAAAGYTSITLATFFLLFKAGDASTVLGQISQMDSKANEVAETGVKIVKSIGAALATGVAAGGAATVLGTAKGMKKGESFKDSLASGAGQGLELFGAKGLGALPGVGNFAQELSNSYREGGADAAVRGEVRKSNEVNKAKRAEISANDDLEPEEKQRQLDALPQPMTYKEALDANKDRIAEDKYRSQVDGGRKYEDGNRAYAEGQRVAEAKGTSMQEAALVNRTAAARGGVYSDLGAATKNIQLNAKGAQVELKGTSIKVDAEAARAMQMGARQAKQIGKQTKPETADQAAIDELQQETSNETTNILNNLVEGKARKIARGAVTTEITEIVKDADGNEREVKYTKPVPQDEMYDQAASKLKKNVRDRPETAGATTRTLKTATENVAAKQLALHATGKQANGNDFELSISPEVKQILIDNGLGDVLTSKDAGDLWIDPDNSRHRGAYEQISALANAEGSNNKELAVSTGHSISLFNQHLARNEDAQKDAIDQIKLKNAEIKNIKRTS